MKFLSKFSIMGLIVILFMGMTISQANQSSSMKSLLKVGDLFPTIKMEAKLSPAKQEYLGISGKTNFTIEDIQAQIIFVEFFNKYCPHCQQQAPILNQIYNEIEKDASLRPKVKIIGIGTGNSQSQLEIYEEEKNIPFPLVPDPEFVFHDDIGRPRTPFMVLVKKNKDGVGIVSDTFLGLVKSKAKLLTAIKKLITTDVLAFQQKQIRDRVDIEVQPTSKLSQEDFTNLVKKRIKRTGATILSFNKISIDKNDIYYKAHIEEKDEEKVIFIKEVYRSTVCDVCHDAHFWYGFDRNSLITYFYRIYLTKAYNEKWGKKDIQKIRQRILNRSILEKFEFNPDVDAVTAATITSSLIFDTLNKAKKQFKMLKKEGIIK